MLLFGGISIYSIGSGGAGSQLQALDAEAQ